MKHFLVGLLFILNYFGTYSQSRETEEVPQLKEVSHNKESNIVFKLGAGLPQGDFGDDSPSNLEGGTAETGFLFEVDFYQQLNSSFYFSLMARLQANNTNAEAVASSLALQTNTTILEVTTDSWRTNSFMIGFGTISTSQERTSLLTRFMLGFSSIDSPSIVATATNGITTVTVNQESSNAGTISFLAGLGLKIAASDQLSFFLNADYYTATPEFSNVTASSSTGPTFFGNFEQKIQILNLSFGVGFTLD